MTGPGAPDRPLRVLHLTGPLNRGGIETWLLNLLRAADRRALAMDVMVIGDDAPAAYDDEVRALGAALLHCPPPQRPLAFASSFLRLLRQHGPYDAVHSHIHHFGALPLLLARSAGVPLRVATSHLDTRDQDARATGGRYAYLSATRALMPLGVNRRLAVGERAAAALYGPDWRRLGAQVQRLGLNLAAFGRADAGERAGTRALLGLPDGMPVLIHVGRFDPQKNHAFLLELFAALLERTPARLLLLGDGPLRPEMERRARELRLEGNVQFLGARGDVPALLAAADAFVFPSHFEGLSLALVEAQLSELPCVISDSQDPASALPGARVTVLPLRAGAPAWADAVRAALNGGRAAPQAAGLDIRENLAQLAALYGGGSTPDSLPGGTA